MATRFVIAKNTAQFRIRGTKGLEVLRPGCTADDSDPEVVAVYDEEAVARTRLDTLSSSIDFFDDYYNLGKIAIVTEYYISCEEAVFDDDGDVAYWELLWMDSENFPAELRFCGFDYRYNLRWRWQIIESVEADEEDSLDE